MKFLRTAVSLWLPAILTLVLAAPGTAQQDDALNVMTFNLRFAHTTPPNLWPDRRPVVREVIERWAPDIVGTQEGLYGQLVDMDEDLPAYDWIGLGRDGGSRGEFMAVFYRRDRLVPLEYDHFWLSDTPEVIGSRTWGNQVRRMVTWVRFRDRRTNQEFYLLNTHFDHQVQESREKSAALVLERIARFDPALPVIVAGDFNVPAGANPVYEMLVNSQALVDTWRAAGRAEPAFGTFHGFRGMEGAQGRSRIDWILTRGPVTTLSTEIITDARDGQYPSDHFPVIARLRLGSGR
jgi:endonuclease/exonuclease/phosphatase family metal-dependent hydrolase